MRLRPCHRLPLAALIVSAAALGGWAGLASAQSSVEAQKKVATSTGAGPGWQSLSVQQRSALAPLQSDWNGIDAARKTKWLEIANRFPRLPADEQQRLHARMAEWARLSPSERARARLNFQETKQISAEERQAKWQAYQALPEPERKALALRAAPGSADKAAGVNPAAAKTQSQKRDGAGMPALAAPPQKAVAPTVVQAAPGATTTLVTRKPKPPPYQQTGTPKIEAAPGFVDRSTLLPKRGPQGAATRSAGNSHPTSSAADKTP